MRLLLFDSVGTSACIRILLRILYYCDLGAFRRGVNNCSHDLRAFYVSSYGGGLGTRFRPLSFNLAKPLFPLAGQPMVHHPILACKKVRIGSSSWLVCFALMIIIKLLMINRLIMAKLLMMHTLRYKLMGLSRSTHIS